MERLSNSNQATGLLETNKNTSLMMIMKLPFPEQLTQIEIFFLTAWVNFPPQSLGCNIFEITLSTTTRRILPVCSLSSSLTASTATAQTAAALTVRLQPDCFFSVWIQRSQADIVFGSNEALGNHSHGFKCFEIIDHFITSVPSFSISSLLLILFPRPSPFCSPFSFSLYPGSSISSYFKISSLHWFYFSPTLLRGFSLLLVRVYFVQQLPHRTVLQFELRLWGNALSDRENGGRGGSLQGCWLEAAYFPLSSSLASNRSWIWSLHI